jgi:PAS domain S-box-containing protein
LATPRLVTRFALVSGVALAVAVGLALLFTRSNAHDQAQRRAVAEATAVARQFADNDLARTAFAWPRPPGSKARDLLLFLDDFFVPVVNGAEPATVIFYSPKGTVTYAADRNLIGTTAEDPGTIRAALADPQYAITGHLQSAYVPVTSAFDPGRKRGVMRLRRDYDPIAAQIQHEFLTQSAIVALALVGLYLAMLPIMRRVTHSLRRAYVERAELAAIVDHSNDAVIGQSSEGIITSWNRGAEAVYGWSSGEATGKSVDLLLPPDRAHDPASEPDYGRTTHVRKDGTPVLVSVTVSPIRDPNGKLVGSSMTSRDVTELTRLESELRESHRQEAVGRLAGGIARDFSDVLGEIDGAVASVLLDPASQHHLERIRAAAARGASLAEQLEAVGGIRTADPEVVDLNEAIQAAAPKLGRLAGSGIAVTTELEDGLGTVFADPRQVEQLILNLTANARGSMPNGGRITLQTANVDFNRRSREGNEEPKHYVMFAVSDSGSLSPEAKERPFEPFYRPSEGGERMALALAAVAGIVKQSGGTMGVESRAEGGTVIRIYLPRVGAPDRCRTV